MRKRINVLFGTCAVLMMVSGFTGCASPAAGLKPDAIQNGQGAFMGQISVLLDGTDKTGNCYADFTGADKSRKAYLNLDKTGWVFSSAQSGDTYFSGLVCTVGGLFKHNVRWESRDLKFQIGSSQQLAYFGHVTLHLHDQGMNIALAFISLGAAAGAGSTATGKVVVTNEMDKALQEYHSKYGESSTGLEVVSAVVPNLSDARLPASQ